MAGGKFLLLIVSFKCTKKLYQLWCSYLQVYLIRVLWCLLHQVLRYCWKLKQVLQVFFRIFRFPASFFTERTLGISRDDVIMILTPEIKTDKWSKIASKNQGLGLWQHFYTPYSIFISPQKSAVKNHQEFWNDNFCIEW